MNSYHVINKEIWWIWSSVKKWEVMCSTCHEQETKKNSESLTGIEPMTLRTSVGCSNHWATKNLWRAGPYTRFVYDMRPRCLRISVVIASDRYTEGHKFNSCRAPGWKGYSIYPWVGRCGLSPCTLTLFETKIADFPTLFKTEFRFLIPCLRHLTRNHTLCKTIINIETLSYLIHWQSQNYLQLDQLSLPCLRQKLIKSIPCWRQKSRKTYPGWQHVHIKPL